MTLQVHFVWFCCSTPHIWASPSMLFFKAIADIRPAHTLRWPRTLYQSCPRPRIRSYSTKEELTPLMKHLVDTIKVQTYKSKAKSDFINIRRSDLGPNVSCSL